MFKLKWGLFQLPELEERNVREKMSIIRTAAIITSLANLEISYGFGPLVLMMPDELSCVACDE